jgi:hypothetical protein
MEQRKETSRAGAGDNAKGAAMTSFLDLAYGVGNSSQDIRSAPDPKQRFKNNQKALLLYYDGFDTTIAEGKRGWQRKIFSEITKNATVATVKLNKPLSKISGQKLARDKQDALREGIDRGQHAAIASEGLDPLDVYFPNFY